MKELSHRQRVQIALSHQEPDRVPLDFGTGGNTSPVPEFYTRLARQYRTNSLVKFVPHIMRLAVIDERILRDLDIDTRPIYMGHAQKRQRRCPEPNRFYDDWGVKWKEVEVEGVIYRELAESPLEDATIDDLDRYPWWPEPLDPGRYAGLEGHVKDMFSQTDFALVGCPSFNGVWERAWYLCGFQRMLEGLLVDVEFVHCVLRHITDITKLSLGRFLELVGPYIQVIKMGDDLGAQNAPLMSAKTYRDLIKPYHQELFQYIKERTEARIFLHSCGSVYKLLDEIVDAGVEILNPVQISARGMDSQQLKEEFGDRLSFWGAIDTQQVLPHGSTEDVKEEVRRRMADLGPGGGYILAPVHNVQADVPVDNLITMYRYARQIGHYPLSVL